MAPGINQITTRWAAIQDPVQFAMRYAPAIQGYLAVFLKNRHDVEDVCQAFLMRVIQKGLVDRPELHGRFRDYLITAVRNAALAHLRRKKLSIEESASLDQLPESPEVELPADEEWISRWRRAILGNVWEAIEAHERTHPGNLAFTVLRALTDHPDEESCDLASRVSQQCGRSIQPDAFRKQVSRARRMFAEFVVMETSRTLEDPTPLRVEEELIDVGLMKYVQRFLPPDWRTSGKLIESD